MGSPPAEHVAISGPPYTHGLVAGRDWDPRGHFLPQSLSLPSLWHHSLRHVGLRALLRG